MKNRDVFKVAFVALERNKLRTALTMLGIIMGIATVVVVVSLGSGTSMLIESQLSAIGDNLLTILPEKRRKGTVHSGLGASNGLTFEDSKSIKRELGHVLSGVSLTIYGSCQIVRGRKNWNVLVHGVGWEHGRIRNRNVVAGHFFLEEDEISNNKVCVIGETIRKKLFNEDEIVIGSVIRISRTPFTVIGLLEPKGANAMGQDQDNIVLLPYTAANAYISKSSMSSVKMIDVSLHSMDDLSLAKIEISSLLRHRHNLSDNVADDFVFRDPIEIAKARNSVSTLASLMLTIMAGISLLVGGIGVMNVMLVSVSERINEIGLRMAIGASPKDILVQFLLEALIISILGGLIGSLVGIGASNVIAATLKWPTVITVGNVLIAVGFSSIVGVIFGFYPAYKASHMNPIECLRFEI